MKNCTHMATVFVLAAVMAIPAAAQNGDQENRSSRTNSPAEQNESQQDQSQEDKKTARRLQVFELKHRDPQYLQQVIALRDGISGRYGAVPGTTGVATAVAAGARVAGQPRANQNQSEEEKMVIAVSAEEKLLFVRGTEEQIQEVQTLVKALDVEQSQMKTIEYANHRLIPIRSEKSGQVQTMLTQLSLGGNVIRMGETTVVAFRTDEEHAEETKQAEEVINKLGANPQSQAKSGNGENAPQKAEAKKAEDKKKSDAQKKEAAEKAAQEKAAQEKPAQDREQEEADKAPTSDN